MGSFNCNLMVFMKMQKFIMKKHKSSDDDDQNAYHMI